MKNATHQSSSRLRAGTHRGIESAMSGIWSAVRWWDEWQMRIIVAASLLIQWFLLLAVPMRKYTIPTWLRRLIWLAYISGDALAIYALATLFNR